MKSFQLSVSFVDVWGMMSLSAVMEFIARKAVSGEIGFVSRSCRWRWEGIILKEQEEEAMVKGEDEEE